MAKRKLYNIKIKDREADPEGKLPWVMLPECHFVSKEYARGWINCSRSYYPSPDIRLEDAYTNELVEEYKGNGEVHVNTN
jgi:hypothetical protein